MEELATVNALYAEAKSEVEQRAGDLEELDELREMKADIERKEKQQAAIIENQVRGSRQGGGAAGWLHRRRGAARGHLTASTHLLICICIYMPPPPCLCTAQLPARPRTP